MQEARVHNACRHAGGASCLQVHVTLRGWDHTDADKLHRLGYPLPHMPHMPHMVKVVSRPMVMECTWRCFRSRMNDISWGWWYSSFAS